MGVESDRQPNHTVSVGAWEDQAEALRQAPGIDPVVAVLEGEQASIPAAGYLIAATVRLGSRKVGTQIHRFDRDHLLLSDPRRPDTMFGVGYVTAELKSPIDTGINFGSLACKSSGYRKPSCYDLTSIRAKIVPVGSEGNYLAISDTHTYNTSCIQLTSYDPLADGNRGRRGRPVAQFARVVTSHDEALEVIRAITAAANLPEEERKQFERTAAEQLNEAQVRAEQHETLKRQAIGKSKLGTLVVSGARKLGVRLH